VAREQGWSVDSVSVSRRWRFPVGRSKWIAEAFVSFHFSSWAKVRGGRAVYAIYFKGNGSASALESSAHLQALRARLAVYRWSTVGKSLVAMWSNSEPRMLLAELDRIAKAFGSEDRHRAPASRLRAIGKRLSAVADTVLAHGTWDLESQSLWIWRYPKAVNISAMPSSARARADISSMLFVPTASRSRQLARAERAESHGYVNRAGNDGPELALLKLQRLSLRAALAEARFLESEISD
jgi:hypothetical protein